MYIGLGHQTSRKRAEAVAQGNHFPPQVSYNTTMGYPTWVSTKGEYQELPSGVSVSSYLQIGAQPKPFVVDSGNELP